MMKTEWKISDILDLEFFFRLDRDVDETRLDRRDREIYNEHVRPVHPPGRTPSSEDYRFVVRKWLEVRRSSEDSPYDEPVLLPGEAFDDFYRTFKILFFPAGVLLGILAAVSLLHYTGTEPVNVSLYFGLLVLTQLLLAVAMMFLMGLRSGKRLTFSPSPLYAGIARFFARSVEKIKSASRERVSGSRVQGIKAIADLIKMKNRVYGTVFYWPIFIIAQIFGVGLNIGILSGTLIRILGTDLAFGWQTTLNLAPSAVYQATRILALPWKWFIPADLAHPTYEQIMGSRIILKEGIHRLATPDLVSWWPFLLLSVIFYGLFPRCLFLIWGVTLRNRRLGQLKFSHADCRRLVTRMLTPVVDSSGSAFSDVLPQVEKQWPADTPPLAEKGVESNSRPMVFIPEDIFGGCKAEDLARHFKRFFSHQPVSCQKITLNAGTDEKMVKNILKASMTPESLYFILLESWQPPIKETLAYLKAFRQMIGKDAPLVVGLVGKPHPGNGFGPVADKDWKLWNQRIAALNDPDLLVERPAI